MIKKGDFIRVEYTAYDDKKNMFDSTSGEIAKQLHGKEGPLLIIFGSDRLIQGLEEAVATMHKGDKKELTIQPEKAFGFRSKDLIKVFPESELLRRNINPRVGVVLELDTEEGKLFGNIKSINSGRVTMDFNHPLAGKIVKYEITLVDLIHENKEKISSMLEDMDLNGKIIVNGDSVEIEMSKPKDDKKQDYEQKKQFLPEMIKTFITDIKNVNIKEV